MTTISTQHGLYLLERLNKGKNHFSLLHLSYDIDTHVENLNTIFKLAASLSMKLEKKNKKVTFKPQKWHDFDLKKMKKTVDDKGKIYAKYPNDPIVSGSFYKIRKEYSKLCKRKYREFKQDLISKIDSLHQNDPKQYWEILNSLRNDYQDSTDSKITPEEWVSHFSNLNKTKQEYTNRVEIMNELLKQKEKIKQFSNLDFKISDQEYSKGP